MSDKTVNVVLQNAYGSYANRIMSVLNLIQRDTKQDYKLLLKFSLSHFTSTSSIWDVFMEYAKCRDNKVITSSDVYIEYKSAFPSSKYKFVRRIGNEPIATRLISILNVKESQECISSIDVSYVAHQELDLTKCSLVPTHIYRLRRTTLKILAWDVSLCEYTYGTTLDDKRLVNGPNDKTSVEALYVDNTINLRENMFKLLAIISPDYDYTKIVFKTHSISSPSTLSPMLITNRVMNQVPPHKAVIYNTSSTNFITLYSYRNLWRRGDYCVLAESKELLYEKPKPIDTSLMRLDNIKLLQAICVVNDTGTYECVMGDIVITQSLSEIITRPTPIPIRAKENWNDVIRRTNGKFVAVYGSQLYYYNKDIATNVLILSSPMAISKCATLWSSIIQTNTQQTSSDTTSNDAELFRKLTFKYNSKYYLLVSMHSEMSNVFKYVYQYIFEDVFVKNPHDIILHIFDGNAISSSELVKLCNAKTIIIVGDVPTTEEYINDIYYSRPIITFHSTSTIYKSLPKVEIANEFVGNSIVSQLIKNTSFIPNSLDMVYIENCFSEFNTIAKFNNIVASIPQLLNRRGKVFVVYLDINTIPDIESEELLYEMFEPNEYLNTIPTSKHNDKSVQINKSTITQAFLQRVYDVRKMCPTTIVVSNSDIEHSAFTKYKYDDKYVYSLDAYTSKMKEYVQQCLRTKKNAFGIITAQDITYCAIDPLLLNTIGTVIYSITPYRTPIVSQYLSQANNVWKLLNKENEPILTSLQMAIVEVFDQQNALH